MNRAYPFLGLLCAFLAAACGAGGDNSFNDGGSGKDASVGNDAQGSDSGGNKDAAKDAVTSDVVNPGCGTGCPSGYTCGTANGLAVCRNNATHIPLFTNVYVILMENTSLATLQAGITAGNGPNLKAWAAAYATSTQYYGAETSATTAAHPSLPNYIALTSGDTQGIGCDCGALPNQGTCTPIVDLCLSACTCTTGAMHIGDSLEAASKTWMDFGENMGTACNLTDNGTYAVRHNPFLYYTNVQSPSSRCTSHVVDLTNFNPASPAAFNFIAPNLNDDMHDQPLATGDAWLGTHAGAILSSSAFKSGGLLVIVWDEDDGSGGLLGNTDNPIGIWVLSPFGKNAYVSTVHANHYSLLATFEDGLDLPRIGNATTKVAAPLTDFFPAN